MGTSSSKGKKPRRGRPAGSSCVLWQSRLKGDTSSLWMDYPRPMQEQLEKAYSAGDMTPVALTMPDGAVCCVDWRDFFQLGAFYMKQTSQGSSDTSHDVRRVDLLDYVECTQPPKMPAACAFDDEAHGARPRVIGISGATRCGKGTLATALRSALGAHRSAVVCQDRCLPRTRNKQD